MTWKKINSIEDMPEESRENEYLFHDSSGELHIQSSYDALNTYICGVDYYGDDIWSDEPYYVEFCYTHWTELPELPN